MFDVGFSELVVIGVVALIVIGPERLPKVARTVGLLVGRLQRYVNDVKADINREMELDELRKIQTQFTDAAREVESSVTSEINATEQALNQTIAAPVSGALSDASSAIGDPAGTSASLDAAIQATADGIPSVQTQTSVAEIPVPAAEHFEAAFVPPDAPPSTTPAAATNSHSPSPASTEPAKTGTA